MKSCASPGGADLVFTVHEAAMNIDWSFDHLGGQLDFRQALPLR